jgi:hypothetical protein
MRETMQQQSESIMHTTFARGSVRLHPRQICPLALSYSPFATSGRRRADAGWLFEQGSDEHDC